MASFIPYILMEGIYAGVIGTISAATMGTYSTIKSIYNHRNPDVINVLHELDIERRLKLIESVLTTKDVSRKPNTTRLKLNDMEKTIIFDIVESKNGVYDDPIELCLNYVYETIQEIHNNLNAINKKVAYHNTKWFNTWRTLNIKPQLDILKTNSNLLESRFNDLIKISEFLATRTDVSGQS